MGCCHVAKLSFICDKSADGNDMRYDFIDHNATRSYYVLDKYFPYLFQITFLSF